MQKTPVDRGSAPGLGRYPGEGTGHLLQYSWASLVTQTVKNSPAMQEMGSIPGLGRSSGGGHGNPLQHSCLEKPHGQRRLWGCSPWGHKELDTTERRSTAPLPKVISCLATTTTHPNPPPQNKTRLYHCSHVKSSHKALSISSSHLIQFFTLSLQILLSQWLSVFGNYQAVSGLRPHISCFLSAHNSLS